MQIGVIGAGTCDEAVAARAERVGRLLVRRGAVVLCGGMGGVMEAAARGARAEGGVVVGVLPGADPRGGNPFLTVRIATGFGHGRNLLIPQSCDGVIAIAGGYGTLSEIAFSLKIAVPLVGIGTWSLDGSFPVVEDPDEAVEVLFGRLRP